MQEYIAKLSKNDEYNDSYTLSDLEEDRKDFKAFYLEAGFENWC